MLTEAQLKERAEGVAASETAAVLGISPWSTPLQLYLEKKGTLPREDLDEKEAVYWGTYLEAPIAARYAEVTGHRVRRKNATIRHPIEPRWLGHIDRDIVGQRRGLEIKNVSIRMAKLWGEPGTDQVAEYYLPQVHSYMAMLDYDAWDVAALVGGNELRIYTVQRDKEMDELLLDAVCDFLAMLDNGTPPDPSWEHQTTKDLLARLYKSTDGETVSLDAVRFWHDTYKAATAEIKDLQTTADVARAHIMAAMGEAARGEFSGGGGYTRKTILRAGYVVEDTEYVDLRYSARLKPTLNEEQK